MKKLASSKKGVAVTIKTGSVEAFFIDVKAIMRAADKKEAILPECSLVFENPMETLHLFSV